MDFRNLFLLLMTGLMVACSPSTKLMKTWVDPALTPGSVEPFKNILVIARVRDETGNRIAEDKIVAKLNVPAMPSYAILTPDDTAKTAFEEKIQKHGFDGLIFMQLTDVNKSLNYQPGTTYYGRPYGGYYGGYYGYHYSTPGYLSEDVTFYVETSIFSLKTGKIMWSGTSATLNPTELEKTLDEIIYSIREDLRQKGFLKSTE